MLKRVSAAVAVVLVLVAFLHATEAQAKRPNPGLVVWSAFSCATFAELSGDVPEQKRLFDLGVSTGRSFLARIEKGTVPAAERQETPIGVLLRLGGPSVDFILGRIFEGAVDDANDKVVKEDSSGLPILDPSKWAAGELKLMRAELKYRGSNCALIQ